MAFDAVLTEPVVVNILVTTGAVVMRDIRKFPEFFPVKRDQFMAFCAVHLFVLADKRVVALIMVEFRGRFECGKIMAGGTIF